MEIAKIDSKDSAAKAANFLKKGKILISPTDTVYGLIADATDKKAVDKVFAAKKRPLEKRLPIFVKDLKMAGKFGEIDWQQEKLLKSFWPGQITFVLKRKKGRKLYGVDEKTIALRIPDHKFTLFLIRRLNRPLIGTSANISGQLASTRISQVVEQFRNEKEQPDLAIDAGNLKPARPSVVIDLTSPFPKILRK